MTIRPRSFVERSRIRGIAALGRDWLGILLVSQFSIWAGDPLSYVLAVWIIGVLQFAVGEALLHEAAHYNLFPSRRVNDAFEWLYALPFFVTVSQYRTEHLKHHFAFETTEDHLLADYRSFGLYESSRNMVWLWFIKPLTGYAGYYYLRVNLARLNQTDGYKVVVLWCVVALSFAYSGWLQSLVAYWLVPYVFVYSSLLYWSEVQDHFNAEGGTRSNVSAIANALCHNKGYHWVHHHYPTIPWYRLAAAHRALCPADTAVAAGFLDVYRQLKNARRAG